MAFSMAWLAAQVEGKTGDDRARGLLAAFRGELYRCFATYRDALLELLASRSNSLPIPRSRTRFSETPPGFQAVL